KPDLAAEAARVAKADLRSAMVGEFPELQGTMGVYYAKAAGLPEAVANACKEHYQPLGPSDAAPTEPVSVAVALADKIDTLTGFWAIDEKPTGSKDPFALRRAALGVIRLVLGNEQRLQLSPLLIDHYWPVVRSVGNQNCLYVDLGGNFSPWYEDLNTFGLKPSPLYYGPKFRREGSFTIADIPEEFDWSNARIATDCVVAENLLAFFHDRLKVHLRDEGIRHDVIDACLAMPGNDDLTLLVRRAEALAAFLKTDDGGNLLQGFRRTNNILTQAEEKDGVEYSFGADPKFAEGAEERALFAALDTAETAIAPAMATEDFAAAMTAMARLRAPIDAFFEAVQVNTDNAIVRRNRLNLLSRIRAICASVADLTKIEG